MTWKDLQFIKEIVIKPEDPKSRMYVEFVDDREFEYIYENNGLLTQRDRKIRLVSNAMYEVHMDYPEDFKKLVAATGDIDEAYRLYQMLKRPVPSGWENYVEENVW